MYRASRDGNTAAAFHEKCDNKGATVVVVRIQNSEQIVGGYNPLSWDSNSDWKSTNDSFIFSLTNRNNLQGAKVGYSSGHQYSVHCNQSFGPWFGGDGDLGFYNNTWRNNNQNNYSVYPKIGIPAGNFNVEDYEVFQVIKK